MTMPDRIQTLSRLIAWGTTALVLAATVMKTPAIGAPVHTDKFVHVALFFVLGGAYFRAYGAIRTLPIALGLVCYGAALEGVQYMLPYRTASFLDACANTAGVATASWWCRGRHTPHSTTAKNNEFN